MSRLNFTLTQLEYVIALNRHGSFAKAAEACFVTQPTLSMQIQKLEESLGYKLFDRTKKPLKLTPEGEALIPLIQATLGEAKKILDTLEDLKTGELSGSLKVGLIPTVAPYLMPLFIKRLAKALPKVSFEFVESQTHEIISLLRQDELDVGIAAIPIEGVSLMTEPLYDEDFYVLCHKNHKFATQRELSAKQLTANDVWLLEEGHCLRGQVLEICRSPKVSAYEPWFQGVSFRGGSLETLGELVSELGGYTLVPALAVEAFRRFGKIIPFKEPVPARQIGFIYARQHYKQRHLKSFKEVIIQALPSKWVNQRVEHKVVPVKLS